MYLSRLAAMKAGIPAEVPAMNVNRLCGSGAQAIVSAVQAALGIEDVGEAVLPNYPNGYKDTEIWKRLYNFQRDAATAVREQAAALQRALDGLAPDFRVAVVLCDVVGMTYEEIGETLGVKMGTVRSRIHRGRALLRESLAHRAPVAPAAAKPAPKK